MALFMVKTWMGNKVTPIYGAEWAGTSDPSWTRTDDAVGFSDPNPYYYGMSGSPSSPFDNIMPWSGMRRVTDASAGELVEIPKFYYKWTRNGSAMKLQISMEQFDGSHVSPAHADRGDGVGERDYVYVGRYHCASDYKSKTGVLPRNSTKHSVFSSNISSLGSNIWIYDYSMYLTIAMLYLVEFAHWNTQLKIGYGCGNGSSMGNMGYTDTMPYHTGTTQTSRTTYGLGTQYRYVEGLWDNLMDGLAGIGANGNTVYAEKNPANYGGNMTAVGTLDLTGWGAGYEIKSWLQSSVGGYEYIIFPSGQYSDNTYNTYCCDEIYYWSMTSNSKCCFSGGTATDNNGRYGLFRLDATVNDSATSQPWAGARLQVLPSSRLSA